MHASYDDIISRIMRTCDLGECNFADVNVAECVGSKAQYRGAACSSNVEPDRRRVVAQYLIRMLHPDEAVSQPRKIEVQRHRRPNE